MHMGLCVLTVSNTLVIPNATVIVRAGVCFWLMLVAIVLFISDTNVSIDLVLIFKCCVVIREMLFVMHGSTVFSGILANVERSEMVCMKSLGCFCMVLKCVRRQLPYVI